LVASPNGASILAVEADGNVLLYNSNQDTFTISRKDTTVLSGAYAASSFDQFVIGDCNRLAHAAALAVAELPGQAYNPLFLHAPPGYGKTHLLHAIGNYVEQFGGGTRVRYTTAEEFTIATVPA
ncbi:hypothetical protein B4Q13_21730, partial [Lacticaseibacillus rhamnosus]